MTDNLFEELETFTKGVGQPQKPVVVAKAKKQEFTYGRYLAFGNALRNCYIAVPTEILKNLLPLLSTINPVVGVISIAGSQATKESVKYNVEPWQLWVDFATFRIAFAST